MIYADYLAHYGRRGESSARLHLLGPLRMLINPSMHAAILIRIAVASPRACAFVWRNILLSKHSIDVDPKCVIGAGLILPHPFGIVLGPGVIGANVLLSHGVTVGAARVPRPGESLFPVIGDRVVIHPGTVVAGAIRVGSDTVIGANSFVDHDLPPHSVYRRGDVQTRD